MERRADAIQPQGATNVGWPATASPWIVAAIALASFILRLWRIDFQSVWLDEAHTAFYVTGQTVRVVVERFSRPGENGPLYYLALLPWREAFGGGEVALRSFSAVAATLAVPATWLALRGLIGGRDALLTAAVVGFAPYLTWYAQEAKMYALALLAGVVSLWLFVSALHHGGARRWVAYAVVGLASIYVHFFALLTLGAHALVAPIVAWPNRRRTWAAWLTIGAVICPVLAWQATAIGRDVAGSGAIMSTGEASLGARFAILAYAYTMNVTPVPVAVVVFVAVALIGFGSANAIEPAWQALRESGGREIVRNGLPTGVRGPLAVVVLAWAPFVAHAAAMGAIGAGLFADRYFVATVPLLYAVAVAAYRAITNRSRVGGAVLAALIVTGGGWATFYQVSVPVKDDFRRAMALFRGGKGDRDAVVPLPHILSYPVAYHSPPGLDIVTIDTERPPVDFAEKFSGRSGVWVVSNASDRYVPLHDVRQWLVGHATLASDDAVAGGLRVQHWRLDGGCRAVPAPDGGWRAPSFEQPCVDGLLSTPELTIVRP